MAVATDERARTAIAPIAVGFALAVGVFVAGPITGGSVNPARSLGPIVIGMWMLAGEFLLLARFFDRLEARLRLRQRGVRVDPPDPVEGGPHRAPLLPRLLEEPSELVPRPLPRGASSGLIRKRPSRSSLPTSRPFLSKSARSSLTGGTLYPGEDPYKFLHGLN
jgi:hypothetical protein